MNLWCPPPTQSPIIPLIQPQSSSKYASHPAGSPLWPLTPAAEQTGESRGENDPPYVSGRARGFSVSTTQEIPKHDLWTPRTATQTPTRSHNPTTFLVPAPAWFLSPCFGFICWGTPRVLSHSRHFSHSSQNSLDPPSSLQPMQHSKLRWSVHLYSAPTRWLMGVQWRKGWLLELFVGE